MAEKTIQIRLHRGMLDNSMKTMKEIPATEEAVRKYLIESNPLPHLDVELSALKVLPYGGPDTRIGWKETYIVKIGGHVVAFTSGAIENNEE